eukprot:TRINITY_DN2500_c0_g1_i1.p1 TRINITY_DN2500_c0_g1~~TRINITY_DN2500_c0_g1_i1.p1  ORF type:complete len:186 (+),score=57.07 TRINITY_DN2500_c0_g1_i1:50-607(+)
MDFSFDEAPAAQPPAEEGLTFPSTTQDDSAAYRPPVIGGEADVAAPVVAQTTEAPAVDSFVAPPPAAGGGGVFGMGDMPSIEASKMAEKTNEALRARDEEADKMHKEIREKAAATLAKMKGDRDSAIAQRKSENQAKEKEQASEHAKLFSDGPIWDRVISLVDTKSDCRRTARMREIYGYLQGQS